MNILHKISPPCAKCPYTLGQVKTLVNPCPVCKENGYKTYDEFTRNKGIASGDGDPFVKKR